MSWFSRAAPTFGRFSPFGRGNQANASSEVNDSDFSYITSEDLAQHNSSPTHRRHRSSSRAAAPEIVDWDDKNPNRETDILVFKNGRISYPTHFPAQSIRDGELRIAFVRQAAAKKLGISDPRRIRLFYKGRQLKFDERTAREEGLRGDGTGSEILCVVGEQGSGSMAPGSEDFDSRDAVDGSDDEDETEGVSDTGTKKKGRKRGGKKKKGKKASTTNDLGYTNSAPTNPEFLPVPSHIPAPRPSSTSPSPGQPSRSNTPQTALQKLDAIATKFHTELVPLCIQYMTHPPEDAGKREFEHKKLAETILAQVVLKLDGVETEGDQDARMRRKELVREAQNMLNKLDEVVVN